MSLTIWTSDALASEISPYKSQTIWRVVEAQHIISTMKFVDNLVEQEILEEILEGYKPALKHSLRDYHYLMAAPFRYGMEEYGSRFRPVGEKNGVFYGSEAVETAVSEMAFYRLLFFQETPGTPLPENGLQFSGFSVRVSTDCCLDLTSNALKETSELWLAPVDYGPCQSLAINAREIGVTMIRFQSVRDSGERANIALLEPDCFELKTINDQQTWQLMLKPDSAVAYCETTRKTLSFDKESFKDPRLSL